MAEQQKDTKTDSRGPGSFCIPRAAFEALLDAGATAYDICAYLVLARFTDKTGRYSTASISAVNRYTGANKVKGGPVDRAIDRLKTIRAKSKQAISNGRSRRSHQMVEQVTDRWPILFDRQTWIEQNGGEIPPDGPTERGKVQFILADFGEPVAERIWFGGNLVSGIGGFDMPLKALKNAGDVAARLLLSMYATNDMETWGGVRPIGPGRMPWENYTPVDADKALHGGARLIRAKYTGTIASKDSRLWSAPAGVDWWKAHQEAGNPVFRALEALGSSGLIYEVVMVLNRNAIKDTFNSGGDYGDIPEDAEPLYELDSRTRHGYKPEGEEGIGGATARTAGDLGVPVAREGGRLDGTYAAIVLRGHPAMIAGIYRLRFRVANPKNAGVKGAWARIYQGNRDAFELLLSIRAANGLAPIPAPWANKAPKTPAPVDNSPDDNYLAPIVPEEPPPF